VIYESDIVLGDRYRDTQTGLEGVATSLYFFQYGCERVNLEIVTPGGEIKDYGFDAPRLEHALSGDRATARRSGGPGLTVSGSDTSGRR
jgi:hypothetical protein